MSDEDGPFVNIGGVPVDLNFGMLGAVSHPPLGFVSKHTFTASDVASRLRAIDWFAKCGTPCDLDLTMPMRPITTWSDATAASSEPQWETATLEAQNQLSLWLFNHATLEDRRWNDIVESHKRDTLAHLEQRWVASRETHGINDVVLHSVRWNVLGALVANSYLSSGHSSFFFLELLWVFEAGHLPCGWDGAWPGGTLLIL